MDHNCIFYQLGKYEKDQVFDLSSEQQVEISQSCEKANDVTINGQHLRTILFLLKSLTVNVLSKSDTFMSLNEYRTVKFAIEKAVSIGIIPCLQPGIGSGLIKNYNVVTKQESLPDLVKYDRLSSTIRTFTDCFTEIALKPAILTQLGLLFSGLFQLAHAPLMKPSKLPPSDSSKFYMTEELYEQLSLDQVEFKQKLQTLLNNCQLFEVMKELFILLGTKNSPKWLQKQLKIYLINALMEPIGVASLFKATCDDVLEKNDFNSTKIDTISQLVTTYYGKDPDKYYTSICSQILDLLNYKNFKNSVFIVNRCILSLYEIHPDICQEKIINIIVQPLMTKIKKLDDDLILQDEKKVSLCIENLTTCFSTKDIKFKDFFCKRIKHISLSLFYMYIKIQNSALLIKSQVKDIIINLLKNDSLSDNLFSSYLEPTLNNHEYFGEKLTFRFGASGGLEIISKQENLQYEQVASALHDLVIDDDDLSTSLFHHLLKSSVHKNITELEIIDEENEINKKIALMKLVTKLANNRKLQKAQIKNPKPIINFVKSLYEEILNKNTYSNDENIEVLYVSVMLIKLILEAEKPNDWKPFDEFADFLINTGKKIKHLDHMSTLINELLNIIKRKSIKKSGCFRDTNINDSKQSEFDEALKETNDPMLPVRAHGLMILTKKIETSDPIALAQKDLLLTIFQKNITDNDSYVYQVAINGLCAMASKYPQELIEILVNVFVDLPEIDVDLVSSENRVKLGETLIKTTRKLGEMAFLHKNILINGFLRGTCDPDALVRASSLSCLGELCKILGFRLGNETMYILSHIENIISTDKAPEARRAAVLVTTLLLRGLGKDALIELGQDLLPLYRGIKHLRDNDTDEVLRLHAQLTLEEFDDIVRNFMFFKAT